MGDLAQFDGPPHSVHAEAAVLGGLMIDPTKWDTVSQIVAEADFYLHDHRLIYRSMATLVARGMAIDVVSMAEALESWGTADEVGGLARLGGMARDTPSAANVGEYASIVRDTSTLRQYIACGAEIMDRMGSPKGATVGQLIAWAEQQIYALGERERRGAGVGFEDSTALLGQAVQHMEQMFLRAGTLTGLSTGIDDLDEMTGGLQPADLIVLAGRPSMGKTSLAMGIAVHAAKAQVSTAVFSMEMQGVQLALRMLAHEGRIDMTKVLRGTLEEDEWPRVTAATMALSGKPLFIDSTGALGVADVQARCRRLAREQGPLGLVVVDYLQLMAYSGMDSEAVQLGRMSAGLKALAKEHNCPVLVLSQLNRGCENRTDKRPRMPDLRGSGSIEQDADLIVFVYRDEVYNKDSPDAGIAELLIEKQRNGPVGVVRTAFLKSYTRFENLTFEREGA